MIAEVSLSRRTFGDGLMVYFVTFFFFFLRYSEFTVRRMSITSDRSVGVVGVGC